MENDHDSMRARNAFDAKWFSEEFSLVTGLYQLSYDGHQWHCVFASDGCFKILKCTDADFLQKLQALSVRRGYDAPEITVEHILQEIIAEEESTAFICMRPWEGGKLQSIKGTLAVSRDGDGLLCVHGQITDVSEEQANNVLAQDMEMIYRNGLHMYGASIYRYQVDGRRGILPPEFARRGGVPEVIDNLPQWNVECGRIAPESIDAWLGIFDAIERGEQQGEANVTFLIRGGKIPRRGRVEFVRETSTEGGSISAIVSHMDINDEYEQNHQQILDRGGLLQIAQMTFPEIFSINLTQGTYRIIQYYDAAGLGTPQEGMLERLLQSHLDHVAPEDQDAFRNRFFRESMLRSIREGKKRIQLTYRRRGTDGVWHWMETIAVHQVNPYGDDVLAFAVSRNVDQQKAQEELLKQALADSTMKLEGWLYYNSLCSQIFPGLIHISYADGRPSPYTVGTLAKKLDCPPHELAMSTCFRIPEEERGGLRLAQERAEAAGETTYQVEYRVETDRGEMAWVSNHAVHFEDKDGAVGYIHFVTETTHEHELMEQLRVYMAERLAENEKIFDVAAKHSDRTICYYDLKTRRARPWNEEDCETCGFPHICFKKISLDDFEKNGCVLPDSVETARRMSQEIHEGALYGVANIHVSMPDDTQQWLEIKYSGLYDGDVPVAALLSYRDVTERHEHEMAYKRYVQQSDLDGEGKLLYIESDLTADRLEKLFGKMLLMEDRYASITYTDFIDELLEEKFPQETRETAAQYFNRKNLLAQYESGKRKLNSKWQVHFHDDTMHWLDLEITLLADAYSDSIKGFFRVVDVTEEYTQQQEVLWRADYEDMTGLLRRGSGEIMIRNHMSARQEPGGILLILDLDDLKGINDIYGHTYGDKAIIGIADTLKSHFRRDEVLIRVGGDEFMIFLPGMAKRVSDVEDSLNSLLYELSCVPVGNGGERTLQCSIGCAVELPDTDTFDSLYQRADIALYHVKRNGKNSFAFFETEMLEDAYQFRVKRTVPEMCDRVRPEELVHLPDVMAHYFSDVVLFNLTQDYFHVLSTDKEDRDTLSSDKVEVFWQNWRKFIHPDDQANILHGMSRHSLLSLYARGKRMIQRYYRNPGEYGSSRTEIITHFYMMDDGDLRAYLLFGKENALKNEMKRPAVSGGGMQEKAISDQSAVEDVLVYCINVLAREKNLDIAVNLLLQAVGSYYRADRSYIVEMDQRGICNTFEWRNPESSWGTADLQEIPAEMTDPLLDIFEGGGAYAVISREADLEPDELLYQVMENQNISSIVAVPLRDAERIVGFMGLDNPRSRERELSLLHAISGFVLEELEKSRLMGELEKMSYTDVLTSLKNRNQYADTLRKLEKKLVKNLGVVILDINGMKEVNDTYGHEYGDEVIKRMAEILRQYFDGNLYRVGGDEFVALCTDLSKEDFQDRVVMLRSALGTVDACDASIGCAWDFNEDSVDIQGLIRQAEEMRQAEKQAYYHVALKEGRSFSRISFAGEVIQEIAEDRFIVYYQPQVDLKTGKVIGAEALVRKKDEDGGIIPPAKFLPFYEVGGVISHVDLFVLRTACETLCRWNKLGYDLHISVNFSRVTLLEPYIVEVITVICKEHHVSPSSITIEVTESVGKIDNERLKELIVELKAAGFSISLDDFGSQYSNMVILAAMDFDEVKFDRSLVSTLEQNEKTRVVVKNGMELCRDLKGTVSLAEGIETKGQLDLLAGYQCDYGQGYYFSKPIPLDEFEKYIEENM